MATATVSFTPVRRVSRAFINNDGQKVEYYEVHGYDTDGKHVVVRAGSREALEAYEVGVPVTATLEVRPPARVEVDLYRPLREASDDNEGTW